MCSALHAHDVLLPVLLDHLGSASRRGFGSRWRTGASQTVGIALDAVTKRALKALAAERFGGNVSALVTEMTAEAVRRAAFERAWKWYGGAEPSEGTRAKIDRELDEGWAHARKARRRRAA